MKYYKIMVFIILAGFTILANYFNIESCIRGNSPNEIGFISSILFISIWVCLSILSSYKTQKWFIIFSVFYWLLCFVTYIVGVYWTLGSALALSLSPLGIIPIYGMAYLAVENNVMLISGTMLIIIILNIILYFRLNNRRYKK